MNKPKVRPDDVERVKHALRQGFWIKGRVLHDIYGIPTRTIRAVAEKTGDIISGQRGYKLAEAATVEELQSAINDLCSRSNHMLDRADRHNEHLMARLASEISKQQGELF